jgi:UDP-N-acetylglucosamine 2-epimerase
MRHYDPSVAVDPVAWLALPDDARLECVIAFHREVAGLRVPAANLRLHAALHVVVETQLAHGDPPETRDALERLLSQGVDRHEAIHVIGRAAAEAFQRFAEQRSYDREAYVRMLRLLGHRRTSGR